jgi:short chain dehydrogenase
MPRPSSLEPRPSQWHAEWVRALQGGDSALLGQLAASDDPAAALLELETYINGLYRGSLHPPSLPMTEIESKAVHVLPFVDDIRSRLGWRIREFDLALLRFMRRSRALSPVLGAGVSMGACAPSWPDLVRPLLEETLTKGVEVRESVPAADNPRQPPITEGLLKVPRPLSLHAAQVAVRPQGGGAKRRRDRRGVGEVPGIWGAAGMVRRFPAVARIDPSVTVTVSAGDTAGAHAIQALTSACGRLRKRRDPSTCGGSRTHKEACAGDSYAIPAASGGAIVHASFLIGRAGFRDGSAYSASKHAVIGLTKSLSEKNYPINQLVSDY